MTLFWHRRDLRTVDNRGLVRASTDGPVVPVFVFDPTILSHAAPARVAFLLDALESLRARYRALGGDLLVERGDSATTLVRWAKAHETARVVWNADYTGLARERDRRVGEALEGAGVALEVVEDALLHEPGSVMTNAGNPYQVYSPFRDTWRKLAKDDPVEAPDWIADVEGESLPTVEDLGMVPPEADLLPAGQDAALDRLDEFSGGPILAYDENRDFPARSGTSRLSADLKFGTVGIRTVWAATEDALGWADGASERAGVETFRDQLAWRDFYAHVLHYNPETVTENYVDYVNPIGWRENSEALAAWKAGETGFPIVDAGMRQLRAEAWMHNRVRMIVASFLTKDLLIDWREGYRHFREHLVDHDTANDVGGWQWAASTGTDAQPFFRIFNPTTQGERYDPDAEYVREHVPELRDVDPATIHAWTELGADEREAIAPDYPGPIVDHAERRETALATFRRARGEDPG